MLVESIKDKRGEEIHIGDHVWTKYRAGSHEGKVEKIVTDEAEAREENVAHPPKVIFHDQHGHRVAHNPSALLKTD